MSTRSLSSVTLQTLKNYSTAASRSVLAYRLGGHRLVRVVNGTLQNRVYPQTAKLAPRATDRMDEVRATSARSSSRASTAWPSVASG